MQPQAARGDRQHVLIETKACVHHSTATRLRHDRSAFFARTDLSSYRPTAQASFCARALFAHRFFAHLRDAGFDRRRRARHADHRFHPHGSLGRDTQLAPAASLVVCPPYLWSAAAQLGCRRQDQPPSEVVGNGQHGFQQCGDSVFLAQALGDCHDAQHHGLRADLVVAQA